MELFADTYALDANAQALVQRLRLLPALAHTRDARIAVLASQIAPRLHGHVCRAFITTPKMQGPLAPWFQWSMAQFCRPLFEGLAPDYLIIYDAALWASMSPVHREALMFHELSHLHAKEEPETGVPKLDEQGRVLLKVVPHDTEVFHEELKRYGPVVLELDEHVAALSAGVAHERRRRRRAS